MIPLVRGGLARRFLVLAPAVPPRNGSLQAESAGVFLLLDPAPCRHYDCNMPTTPTPHSLKRRREKMGLSVEAVAAQALVSASTLLRWERGVGLRPVTLRIWEQAIQELEESTT